MTSSTGRSSLALLQRRRRAAPAGLLGAGGSSRAQTRSAARPPHRPRTRLSAWRPPARHPASVRREAGRTGTGGGQEQRQRVGGESSSSSRFRSSARQRPPAPAPAPRASRHGPPPAPRAAGAARKELEPPHTPARTSEDQRPQGLTHGRRTSRRARQPEVGDAAAASGWVRKEEACRRQESVIADNTWPSGSLACKPNPALLHMETLTRHPPLLAIKARRR